MNESDVMDLIEEARGAAAAGDWQRAHALLARADASGSLSGPDLALLGEVAYAAGRLDVTIDAWERAYAEGMRTGDHLAAAGAAVRVAMHLLFDTALMAPVRGWVSRAERLLEGHGPTAAQAWLAVVRNYERLLSGDFQSAGQWARRAIELGTQCDPAAAAIGRVAEARSLILAGDVSHGVALLNEAAVAAVSGELDPLFRGMVYCEVVCAFQALAQFDLAEEWTAAMERWCRGQPVGSVHGRCRVHRAEILRLRGASVEAEREVLSACEELRPYLRREIGWPLTELGRIRMRKGDIQGADEAFRAAHDVGWDAQPGLALVLLARGDVELAAESIRDALANAVYVPSKELPPHTELRRAPLLEAQVEIEVAAGDLALARAAADDLSRVAALFESKALGASAALAHGRVALAEGDAATARRELEEAVHLWSEIGAPYETAVAQMGLAHALRAAGNEAGALLELRAARSAFERVGAVHQVAEADRASDGDGSTDVKGRKRQAEAGPVPVVVAAGVAGAADENVFRREGDYWLVAYQGVVVRLRDVKGLRYLTRLLANPGRELHVLDLVAGERDGAADASPGLEDGTAVSLGDAGPLLDAPAKAAYRRRLAEIDEDIEEARGLGDGERGAQSEAERDFLVREMARAVGLGGRDRRAGSTSERARASVTRAVRQAMVRISEHHPALGEHFDHAIRTGTYCAYLPDPRASMVWRL
jgi:tetratricopeptide (TPR) repeat protein